MLVLFDIDGTLLLTGGAGSRALNRACAELYGISGAMDGIRADGKTDPLLVQDIFRNHLGRDPSSEEIGAVLSRYVVHLGHEVARADRFRVMPGVEGAIAATLAAGATVGLATGNTEDGARIKLARADLWRWFAFGGYGSDSGVRAELVAVAIARGERHAGRAFAKDEVIVIGDTPRDVDAAHACGAIAIAVATGPHPMERLRAAGADVVLATLDELPAWLAARGSAGRGAYIETPGFATGRAAEGRPARESARGRGGRASRALPAEGGRHAPWDRG